MSTSTNVIRRYSRRGYPLRVGLSLWLCNIATSLYHIVSELNKNGIRLRNSTNLLHGWAVASPLRIFRRPGRCVSKANGKQRHTGQGGYAPCRRRLPASRKHEMRRLSASSRGDTCQPDLRPPPPPCPNGHSLGVCHVGVGFGHIVAVVLLLRRGQWGKVRHRERRLTFALLGAFLLPAACLRFAMGDGGGSGARVGGSANEVACLASKGSGDITHSN